MLNKKNIWIVSEFYYPMVTSTGYYMTEIAEFLAKKGKNVHVICTNSTYNEKEEFEFIKFEEKNGVKISRVKSSNIDKNKFFQRIIKLLKSSILMFFKLLFSVKRNEQIFLVTNPAFLLLLMPIVKKIKSVDYMVLVHDIFPENLAAIGQLNANSFVYKFLKRIYNYSYRNADRCIVIGRDMKEVLIEKGVSASKIDLITNWSDVDEVYSIDKSCTNMYKDLKLEDKFIFEFAGNLGHAQGLENIMEAIELVQNDNIHFLFIGSGAMETKIKEFSTNKRISNVTHLGFQPRENQNDFLNATDVSIVTLSEGMFGLGVPSKAYNIMATGKPMLVIADENSEISLCVKEHKMGWLVEPNNPKTLSDKFIEIYECYKNNHQFSLIDSRKVAIEYYSKNVVLEKYVALFDN